MRRPPRQSHEFGHASLADHSTGTLRHCFIEKAPDSRGLFMLAISIESSDEKLLFGN